jgi:HEAT repeat protein
MKHRIIAISTGSLLVTGAVLSAVYFIRPAGKLGGTASSPATSARSEHAPAPRAPRAPRVRLGWEPGVRYSQTIDLRVGLDMAEKAEEDSPAHFQLRLGGVLETWVSEARGSEVRVRLRIVEPTIEAGTHAVPPEVVRAFATPFFVDYDVRGRALRLHLTPGLDRTVQGILRELVATAQLSTPELAADRWTAVESDTMGDYKADYQALGSTRVLRHKSGYVRIGARHDEGSQPRPQILAYAAEFELDDWGRAKALRCTSRMRTAAGDTGIVFDSRAELTLAMVSRSRDTGGLPLSAAELVVTPLVNDGQDAQDTASRDRQLVAGTNVKALLSDLRETKDDGQTASRVRHRLSLLFRFDEHTIASALAVLDDSNAATILGGLGAAGTPQAQKALRDVLRDARFSQVQREAAVDGTFALEQPSPETAAAIEALTRSSDPALKQSASLALGVATARMAEADPAAADGVVERVSREYSSATSSEDRIRLVGSLGNTRSGDALPALTNAMASDEPAVRTAAAAALRFVPDPAADVLLAKAMTSDPEPSVRSAALMAAGYRAYDPLAEAFQIVAKDSDPNLRGALVATLAQMATHDGQALLLLEWLAANDPSNEVRAKAQGELSRT